MVKSLHPLTELSSQLSLAPEIEIRAERTSPQPARGVPSIDDPAEAAARALASPLNYPPFDLGIVPGDRLAIAVDETVPCAVRVVRGVVAAGERAGIERDAIAIVADDEALLGALRDDLGNGSADGIRFVIHDPDDPQDLCLVGMTEKSERLLVNRALYEADVVLPVGCARLAGVAHSNGVYDSLFPRFCDAETIARLRTPSQQESSARQAAARRSTAEAGWLLGVPLVMQVVPGGGGRVAEIVAGEPQAVAAHCDEACRRLWSLRVPRRASLVIASIIGGREVQTWDNIARALAATEAVVADGGAVAICSDLDIEPGHSLSRLAGSTDWAAIERDARNDHSPDSWPAWQLARALQRGPVYFLSQLADETVEEMGLAPVSDLAELARLASRHESCIVLDDSQHAVATVAGESPSPTGRGPG